MRGRVLAALGMARRRVGRAGRAGTGLAERLLRPPRLALQVGGVSCVVATLLAAAALARFRKTATGPAPARVAMENA
ncbi:hypothetical protein ACFSTC_14380 [Nonomuraea ferruginea]